MAFSTKLDQKLIGYITTFENVTRARVKDMLVSDDGITFIVNSGDAGKAIGRHGDHIRRLTYLLKKKIKVIEFSDSLVEFVKNVLDPLRVEKIDVNDKNVTLVVHDPAIKGKIIGRNGKNLHFLNDLLGRYFDCVASVAR